jgi:hypothetical protein
MECVDTGIELGKELAKTGHLDQVSCQDSLMEHTGAGGNQHRPTHDGRVRVKAMRRLQAVDGKSVTICDEATNGMKHVSRLQKLKGEFMNGTNSHVCNDSTAMVYLGELLDTKAVPTVMTKRKVTDSRSSTEASPEGQRKVKTNLTQGGATQRAPELQTMETKKFVQTSRFPLPHLPKDAYALDDEAWKEALTKPPLSTAVIGPQGRETERRNC